MSHLPQRIWNDSPRSFADLEYSSSLTGSARTPEPTPFGLYDSGSAFRNDAPRIAKWAANRLGYPIQNVELLDINFYACFEEAVSEYGAQVNQFNIRNNLDTVQGRNRDETQNLTQRQVTGTNLQTIVELSEAYGTQATLPVGGDVPLNTGFVKLRQGNSYYQIESGSYITNRDPFNFETGSISGSFDKIQVTRVFYEEAPALVRFFDPHATTGVGTLNTITAFGFGGFSPATQFVLMPLYEDLLRMQAIEFNDKIRKSGYSFHLVNNKIQIFPTPIRDNYLFFEFMDESEKWRAQSDVRGDVIGESTTEYTEESVISDYSNIPYSNIPYSRINDVGKQWIRKYTLALAKELLGAIREKYATVPIPDAEISLDGAALRSEAQQEKEQLVSELRENLEDLSRRNQMELKNQESEYQQEMLRKIPLPIYIA